jgi:hypothetical protein
VLGREIGGLAVRLVVDDEVDAALAVQQHLLGAVAGHQREAHAGEQFFQLAGLGEANSTNSKPIRPIGFSS